MKNKRSEEYSALEEVFDKSTLMTIYSLMNRGVIDQIFGAVKAGKESKLYWGKGGERQDIAIKIFLTVSSEFRKGMLSYIVGDPRFKHVRRDHRSMIYTWARKEYRNLCEASDVNVRVPKPIFVEKNVLIMEFIGVNGQSAPLLKEVELDNPEKIYEKILLYIRSLYKKANLVHGDLSEYNIMIWENSPVLFDFSQAVNLKHPNAEKFLIRDIENLNHYFDKIGITVYTMEETYRRITSDTNLR